MFGGIKRKGNALSACPQELCFGFGEDGAFFFFLWGFGGMFAHLFYFIFLFKHSLFFLCAS